jgi:hypothetical protein
MPWASEGQQGLKLRIQLRRRLLGLPLGEQLIEELGKPDEPPAPALFAEEKEQAIAAGGELKAMVGAAQDATSSAGRGQGPATPLMCRVMRHHRQLC